MFGKHEVGKGKQAQNRVMILPGPLRNNESTVRENTSDQLQLQHYTGMQRILIITEHMVTRIWYLKHLTRKDIYTHVALNIVDLVAESRVCSVLGQMLGSVLHSRAVQQSWLGTADEKPDALQSPDHSWNTTSRQPQRSVQLPSGYW